MYYTFTFISGDSTRGAVYKPILDDIIQRCHGIGLKVVNVTSDMGSSNQAMWGCYGIYCGPIGDPTFSCPHPADPDMTLHFMADIPHLIKNLKAALVNNNSILYKDRIISIAPVRFLANYQSSRELKIAPKLTVAAVTASHFDKMKVSNATKVLSNSVSSGLIWMVNNGLMDTNLVKMALDTAWFIGKVNHWFDLMSSRHAGLALSYAQIDKYDSAIADLTEFRSIARDMKIGSQHRWKPVQTGIVLSTSTVLSLTDTLLSHSEIKFIMTSRFTQDCLENLFSSVRLRNPTPTPIEFRNALKIITVAQFLKRSRHSSYDDDESSYLINYLEPVEHTVEESIPTEVVVIDCRVSVSLDASDLASLYYIAGISFPASVMFFSSLLIAIAVTYL